ncbi:IS3 family transposase [Planococcus shenhongbingii]|uniref:IS3 family transposase n=1 Tax=Planococcus shenhongbingii TaxID=3058398 RepID=UPI00345CA4E9
MSRKTNCWDNAVIESFFSHLKTEFPFHSQLTSLKGIQEGLHKFITYYNIKRGQKCLGYLSSEMYYQAFLDSETA